MPLRMPGRRRRGTAGGAPGREHPAAVAFPLSAAGGVDPEGRSVRVSILSRSGCHLCDAAEAAAREVCAELDPPVGVEVALIEDFPGLLGEYGERVPVVFVDNRPHDFWRVDPQRLREVLTR